MGRLYIVATPIGNLGDITNRALETLRAVDVVACEDTRHTRELLTHFEIHKTLLSCRVQNEAVAGGVVIKALAEGKDVAYCSDAGTPGISDPGSLLVQQVRAAGFPIVPIPGASAFATIASVAGVGKSIIFEGFLSPKSGRRRSRLAVLKTIFDTGSSIILYESPYRILKLLGDIADIYGESRVVVGRELTKLHEEIVDGTPAELLHDFSSRQSIKGEFVLVITHK